MYINKAIKLAILKYHAWAAFALVFFPRSLLLYVIIACFINSLFTVSGPSDLISLMSSLNASFSCADNPFLAALLFRFFRRFSSSM